MKYRHNHPAKDLARSLDLDKKAENRLQTAIQNAYRDATPDVNNTLAMDDFIALVAPYIHNSEEAFFAAFTIIAEVEVAKTQYFTKRN